MCSENEEHDQHTNDELLDDIEVSHLVDDIDKSIDTINSGPVDNRANNFLTSNTFLTKFYDQMEQEPDLNEGEEEKLDAINAQLENKRDVVNEIIESLIESQRQNLIRKGLPRKPIDQVAVEINHIKEVVRLTQDIFPSLPILHLAAAVHDSYKYKNGKMELGLHEIASTALGPVLVEKLLRKHMSKLDIDLDEIALVKKLVQSAVLTHGSDEFPERVANYKNSSKVGNLFGSVYPKTSKRSWTLLKKRTNTTSQTIAGLNYLDVITGTNINSFIKYNYAPSHSNELLSGLDMTLSVYIGQKLLSGFKENIEMYSGELLQEKIDLPELKKIIDENTRVKDIIILVINGERRGLFLKLRNRGIASILKSAYTKLETKFRKLQKTCRQGRNGIEERNEFNAQLIIFFNAARNAAIFPQK